MYSQTHQRLKKKAEDKSKAVQPVSKKASVPAAFDYKELLSVITQVQIAQNLPKVEPPKLTKREAADRARAEKLITSAQALEKNGEVDLVINNYLSAIKTVDTREFRDLMTNVRISFIRFCLKQKRYELAEVHSKFLVACTQDKEFKGSHPIDLWATLYGFIGRYYLQIGDFEAAKKFFEQGFQLILKTPYEEHMGVRLKQMSGLAASLQTKLSNHATLSPNLADRCGQLIELLADSCLKALDEKSWDAFVETYDVLTLFCESVLEFNSEYKMLLLKVQLDVLEKLLRNFKGEFTDTILTKARTVGELALAAARESNEKNAMYIAAHHLAEVIMQQVLLKKSIELIRDYTISAVLRSDESKKHVRQTMRRFNLEFDMERELQTVNTLTDKLQTASQAINYQPLVDFFQSTKHKYAAMVEMKKIVRSIYEKNVGLLRGTLIHKNYQDLEKSLQSYTPHFDEACKQFAELMGEVVDASACFLSMIPQYGMDENFVRAINAFVLLLTIIISNCEDISEVAQIFLRNMIDRYEEQKELTTLLTNTSMLRNIVPSNSILKKHAQPNLDLLVRCAIYDVNMARCSERGLALIYQIYDGLDLMQGIKLRYQADSAVQYPQAYALMSQALALFSSSKAYVYMAEAESNLAAIVNLEALMFLNQPESDEYQMRIERALQHLRAAQYIVQTHFAGDENLIARFAHLPDAIKFNEETLEKIAAQKKPLMKLGM